jgi:O-antigen/teichoic acid export membrane protein
MAIGLAALADRFVPLYYGESFVAATAPLVVLLPGTVGFAAARPLQAINQGSGRIRALVAASGAAAVLNLALNAAFIPQFGMIGAAVATSVGYGSMFVFLVWAARHIGYDPLDDFRAVRITVTALVAAPFILVLDGLLAHDILALLVVPPVGCAIYSGAAVATGALDSRELLDLLGKLPDPVGRRVET